MQRNTQEKTSTRASQQQNGRFGTPTRALSKVLLIAVCTVVLCMQFAFVPQTASEAEHPTVAVSAVPEPTIVRDPPATQSPLVATEQEFAQMFEFKSNDDGIVITKYLGNEPVLEIPSRLGTIPVTVIASFAFAKCDTLQHIVIPESVTRIDDNAFAECKRLTAVELPNSLPYLGFGVFYGCSALTHIVIPDSVTRMDCYTFAECERLTTVELPDSLLYLGSGSFYGCSALTQIEVPGSVKALNENTFYGCKKLKTATLHGALRQFAVTAFAGCDTLTITAPPDSYAIQTAAEYGIRTEEADADAQQTKPSPAAPASDFTYELRDGGVVLTNYTGSELSILLPDRIEGRPVVGVCNGTDAEDEWSSEPSGWRTPYYIEIPEGVTRIGDSTFASNMGLREIILPNSLTYIGEGAFNACCSLANLVIPAGVTEIGKCAFAGTGIYDITIPGSVQHLGEALFVENMSLRHASIQEGVRSIPATLFFCWELESVQLPTTVTSIAENAFLSSCSLHEITLPEGLTSIGFEAFAGSALEEVVFPSSVETVGAGAFADTPFLDSMQPRNGWIILGDDLVYIYAGTETQVTVPKEYTNVDFYSAFYAGGNQCPVEEIILEAGTESITDGAFYNCDFLQRITIPDGVTSIGKNAFGGCGALSDITIPRSVRHIGAEAFGYDIVIHCPSGSYAEKYAKQNELPCVIFND